MEGVDDCGLVGGVRHNGVESADPPFRAHTKLVSGFVQTEDHSLWPAGLWGWCYTATKSI